MVPAALDFLQDALLRHLLLQDLHRFFDGIPNFYFEGASEQCLQAILQMGLRSGRIREGCELTILNGFGQGPCRRTSFYLKKLYRMLHYEKKYLPFRY